MSNERRKVSFDLKISNLKDVSSGFSSDFIRNLERINHLVNRVKEVTDEFKHRKLSSSDAADENLIIKLTRELYSVNREYRDLMVTAEDTLKVNMVSLNNALKSYMDVIPTEINTRVNHLLKESDYFDKNGNFKLLREKKKMNNTDIYNALMVVANEMKYDLLEIAKLIPFVRNLAQLNVMDLNGLTEKLKKVSRTVNKNNRLIEQINNYLLMSYDATTTGNITATKKSSQSSLTMKMFVNIMRALTNSNTSSSPIITDLEAYKGTIKTKNDIKNVIKNLDSYMERIKQLFNISVNKRTRNRMNKALNPLLDEMSGEQKFIEGELYKMLRQIKVGVEPIKQTGIINDDVLKGVNATLDSLVAGFEEFQNTINEDITATLHLEDNLDSSFDKMSTTLLNRINEMMYPVYGMLETILMEEGISPNDMGNTKYEPSNRLKGYMNTKIKRLGVPIQTVQNSDDNDSITLSKPLINSTNLFVDVDKNVDELLEDFKQQLSFLKNSIIELHSVEKKTNLDTIEKEMFELNNTLIKQKDDFIAKLDELLVPINQQFQELNLHNANALVSINMIDKQNDYYIKLFTELFDEFPKKLEKNMVRAVKKAIKT